MESSGHQAPSCPECTWPCAGGGCLQGGHQCRLGTSPMLKVTQRAQERRELDPSCPRARLPLLPLHGWNIPTICNAFPETGKSFLAPLSLPDADFGFCLLWVLMEFKQRSAALTPFWTVHWYLRRPQCGSGKRLPVLVCASERGPGAACCRWSSWTQNYLCS